MAKYYKYLDPKDDIYVILTNSLNNNTVKLISLFLYPFSRWFNETPKKHQLKLYYSCW